MFACCMLQAAVAYCILHIRIVLLLLWNCRDGNPQCKVNEVITSPLIERRSWADGIMELDRDIGSNGTDPLGSAQYCVGVVCSLLTNCLESKPKLAPRELAGG